MGTFLATLLVFGLAFAGLTLGLLFGREPVRGAAWGGDGHAGKVEYRAGDEGLARGSALAWGCNAEGGTRRIGCPLRGELNC